MASDAAPSQPNANATATHASQAGLVERGYCRLHRVTIMTRYPVQPRPELAIRRPAVVATRPGEELLCNCEHSGPHLWPDGDEAGDWPDTDEPGFGDSQRPESPNPDTRFPSIDL